MLQENEKEEKKRRKRTRTIVTHFLYPSPSPSASNQPTNRSCCVAMTNITHTTIFRLHRSDTPTSQNQSSFYNNL